MSCKKMRGKDGAGSLIDEERWACRDDEESETGEGRNVCKQHNWVLVQ